MRNLADLLSSFIGFKREEIVETPSELERCLYCDTDPSTSEQYRHYRVCPSCGFHYSISARERIRLLVDEDTFKETDRSLISLDPLSFSGKATYREKIFQAQRRTGLTEAVVTGTCNIGGGPAVIIALDFGFLGGSMGCVVGEKVALAFERATKKKLPVVAVVTSGGARIQEGVLSLMQMAKTTGATKRHHEAHLPFIAVLANPTTGQVYSSFANVADIILAEPGALIGLAPLRVVEQTAGKPLPQGAHTAEDHLKHGMIDLIVERSKLGDLLPVLLDLLSSRYKLTLAKRGGRYTFRERSAESPWQTVQLARHEMRPTSMDYIGRIISNFVELHGDRMYGDDPAIICGLGYLSGEAVVVIGQERGHGKEAHLRNDGRAYPEGFRKAQRAMKLAGKFRLPLVTFIDTPGAYPGLESEERGIGNALASTMALLSDLPTPVISVIIGEGGSEGALALGVADRTLILENAIYSPISPEGAATLLYRDAAKAEEVTPSLKLTAHDCKQLGIIDVVIPEPRGGAHADPEEAAHQVQRFVLQELLEIQSIPLKKLINKRYEKFRRMGEYSSHFRAAISREVGHLQGQLARGVKELRGRLPGKGREAPELNNEEGLSS